MFQQHAYNRRQQQEPDQAPSGGGQALRGWRFNGQSPGVTPNDDANLGVRRQSLKLAPRRRKVNGELTSLDIELYDPDEEEDDENEGR